MTPLQLCILIADRNLERSQAIGAVMKRDDHRVFRAHDATSVLALAREHAPDAVFFDPSLVGADGYELARRLRRGVIPETTAIIGLTDVDPSSSGHESEIAVDLQLPAKFDVELLSGLIHYACRLRR